MRRIPEVELMDEDVQARAYAEADFSEPHGHFIRLFQERHTVPEHSKILDLGCGPADISIRMARAFPTCSVDGVDGAQAMLDYGLAALEREKLDGRVHLRRLYLPTAALENAAYDVIISNSLLHHLLSPNVLWHTLKQAGRAGTVVFIMDLLRPGSTAQATELVRLYAADEPDILCRDFYHSLCAAYTLHEVQAQLQAAGLENLQAEQVSDRHWVVSGTL